MLKYTAVLFRRCIVFFNFCKRTRVKNKEELDTALPTEKEFYELTKSKLLDLLHEDDIVVLNAICSEFVTNLRAGNDSTPVIKLDPPYDLMVDLGKILIGRGERT